MRLWVELDKLPSSWMRNLERKNMFNWNKPLREIRLVLAMAHNARRGKNARTFLGAKIRSLIL